MRKRRGEVSDRAEQAAARASRVQKSGSFAESYLSYLLARASHAVASGFHARLKTWRLTVPEYRVLFCLAGAGDGRRVLIHLTSAGRARAAPVLRAAKAHEARLLAPFSAEERAVIKRALDLLINGRA